MNKLKDAYFNVSWFENHGRHYHSVSVIDCIEFCQDEEDPDDISLLLWSDDGEGYRIPVNGDINITIRIEKCFGCTRKDIGVDGSLPFS